METHLVHVHWLEHQQTPGAEEGSAWPVGRKPARWVGLLQAELALQPSGHQRRSRRQTLPSMPAT